jgi:hypothetical protein
MRGQGHDPPVTVLAEDEFPALAEPVDSDEDAPLELADGVGVLDDDVVVEEVDVVAAEPP